MIQTHSVAYFLRLCSLQHMTVFGVDVPSQVAPTWFVPLSGFGYPLNGLLLPKPLDHYFRPKRSWVLPRQSFCPHKRSVPLSSYLCFLAVNPPGFPGVPLVDLVFKALISSADRLSPPKLLHFGGRLTLLGLRIPEAFSLATHELTNQLKLFCTSHVLPRR
jgi:hypothetical protein